MPPRQTTSDTRCQYREGRRRCARNATGSGFCGAHQSALESTIDAGERGALGDLVGRLINGDRISRATFEQAAADMASRVLGRRVTRSQLREMGSDDIDWETLEQRIRDGAQQAAQQASQRARSRFSGRPSDPEAQAREQARRASELKSRARASDVSKARRILGYSAKEPITRDQVKDRQRELARKHHPDRGGSVARMQDINWAVDILMQPG